LKTKICGLMRPEDAALAASAGADYVGVVVKVAYSKRSLDYDEAQAVLEAADCDHVVLLLEPSLEELLQAFEHLRPQAFQLVGEDEPAFLERARRALPEEVELWKSLHLPAGAGREFDLSGLLERARAYAEAGAAKFILDSKVGKEYGGTGRTSNWELARQVVQEVDLPVLLAGGLSPDNVAEAVKTVQPFGVDVATGVEKVLGEKSPEKVRRFIAEARAAAGD